VEQAVTNHGGPRDLDACRVGDQILICKCNLHGLQPSSVLMLYGSIVLRDIEAVTEDPANRSETRPANTAQFSLARPC
jgi:hypothetical protein